MPSKLMEGPTDLSEDFDKEYPNGNPFRKGPVRHLDNAYQHIKYFSQETNQAGGTLTHPIRKETALPVAHRT